MDHSQVVLQMFYQELETILALRLSSFLGKDEHGF